LFINYVWFFIVMCLFVLLFCLLLVIVSCSLGI